MKGKTFISLLIFFFLSKSLPTQAINVYPVPQQTFSTGKMIPVPPNYVIEGLQEADENAVALLQTIFDQEVNKASFKISIGKKGDKSVKPFSKEIPDREEGYYLKITPDRLVIAGSDDRGTYYAVQTLLQLLQDNQLPEITIKDYPDVRFRGVVEGFYGTPWSFNDRLRQIEFYGKNKINTYIYGPKDDPYHSSPHWRDPYPEAEADKIRQLVNVSGKNKVDFVWAIHPGKDIQWTETDKEAIFQKFESMYQLGVRSFAVFFDDISGVGTDPQKQAELLNYLDDEFVSKKKDVTPLIMCPTEYNKSWSNPEKGYLKTLGTVLNPTVHIMWTGDRVIAEITEPGMQWINEQIGRPAYIWWNFPVSDYVRDHLLMGRVYGNDTTIAGMMSGFVANPMERAEASKIAIFSVADYTWNMEAYDSQKSWESSILALMPVSSEPLYKFSAHNSDLGRNGHGFRREESVGIAPVVSRIENSLGQKNGNGEDILRMVNEFEEITRSANILLGSNDNEILLKEIEPWVLQFKNLGETGESVMKFYQASLANDTIGFEKNYNYIKTLRRINYHIDKSYNQNPYQPGVKTGSLVLQPFIDKLFSSIVENHNTKYGTAFNPELTYQPYLLTGTVAQLKNLPVQSKLNRISLAPVNEIVMWGTDEYIQLEMDKDYTLQTLKIDLEPVSSVNWLKLEVSNDQKNWETVNILTVQNPIELMLDPLKAKYIRLKNIDTEKEIRFKGLTLTIHIAE